MRWDPIQYGKFAAERSRPFLDLVGRVDCDAPRRVVDLGCGTGTLTALLAQRWPSALVEGIDSSPEMIDRARGGERLSFRVADVAAWRGPPDADVVLSNATLQWVPEHVALLRTWADALPARGWLAFQVPGNFDSPSHARLRALASSPRWARLLGDALRHHDAVQSAQTYAGLLLDAGLHVDVWETTYLHVLSGSDPVLEWMRGTGLRPVLAALAGQRIEDRTHPAEALEIDALEIDALDTGHAVEAFEADYAAALREAYPAGKHGTLFPYRRIFVVAHRP
ncbi:MAG: trans-aconitate methyltransferase [Pseudonocardiales bacterium]|nr:trans-aconitate methyltransferase [Pseudonocardiales bacterium]